MADLGDPTSYLELPDGVPVLSADGHQIGTVAHVLADADADIFDGIVIDARRGPGGHRFADAAQIDRLYTGARSSRSTRPPPSGCPSRARTRRSMPADPDDTAPDDLGDKLKRAWAWISGNY